MTEGTKMGFWEEMALFFSGKDIILWADFNTIRFLEERMERRLVTRAMDEFSQFIDIFLLIFLGQELYLHGLMWGIQHRSLDLIDSQYPTHGRRQFRE